jgi:hypothetical protein
MDAVIQLDKHLVVGCIGIKTDVNVATELLYALKPWLLLTSVGFAMCRSQVAIDRF